MRKVICVECKNLKHCKISCDTKIDVFYCCLFARSKLFSEPPMELIECNKFELRKLYKI